MTPSPSCSGIHALLPIKNLAGVKTRLGNILSAEERRLLVSAMAEDVVTALKATHGLASIKVISHDTSVVAWAQAHDLDLVDDAEASGLSNAIGLAARQSSEAGADAILIVLADTPLASASDFEALIEAHQTAADPAHFILSPSRDDDGSNCLLVAPPDAMTFHYGPGSASAHSDEARSAGLAVTQLKRPGIAHDIDTEADLRDLISSTEMLSDHSRTRQFLTTSGIAARLGKKRP